MSNYINWNRNFNYIVGRNGSGKTTLVNKLLKNEFLNNYRVAYLDQSGLKNIDRILISVDELINSANYIKPNKNFSKVKHEVLTYFNLNKLLIKKTNELSGGEKQILLICVQLLKDVDIYIFDEPFNNLDSQVIKLLNDYLEKLSCTKKVLVISHHLDYICKNSNVYEVKNHQINKEYKGEYY